MIDSSIGGTTTARPLSLLQSWGRKQCQEYSRVQLQRPDSQDERFIEHLLQLADFLVGQQMDEQGRGNLVFRNFRISLRLSHPS